MTDRPCEACGGGDFRQLYRKDAHDFQRCRRCGLIRIHPQPTDAVLAQIYGTHYYDAWGMATGAGRVIDLKKATFRKHVFSKLKLENGARILDCGAAYGALMEAARDAGWEPYGIELPSAASAAIAEKFGAERVFAGAFEQAHFPSLGDAPFDAVFMCDFIEHVRDPEAVLRKAASLLRPGGHLVATTPDGSSLSSRLMGAAWPHAKVEHLYFYDPRNFARLLDRAGLQFVRAGRARKVLDLDYLQRQFATYPRLPITPLLNLLTRSASASLRQRPLSFSFGEMIAVAQRPEERLEL